MSAIDTGSLKSASDPLIPFITRLETVGTAQIRHDSLLEWGLLIKSVKITNNDTLAVLTVRTNSPSNGLISVDPASELVIEEWTSYLELNPNAVSGVGQIEIDLVQSKDARK